MHINATFLVQIINFLITYYVLDRFLFRPIIAALKQKQARVDSLQHSIEKEEEGILALEKEKRESVLSFQRRMKKEFPYLAPTASDKPIDIEIDVTKTPSDKTLQDEVTDFLVNKVPDAY